MIQWSGGRWPCADDGGHDLGQEVVGHRVAGDERAEVDRRDDELDEAGDRSPGGSSPRAIARRTMSPAASQRRAQNAALTAPSSVRSPPSATTARVIAPATGSAVALRTRGRRPAGRSRGVRCPGRGRSGGERRHHLGHQLGPSRESAMDGAAVHAGALRDLLRGEAPIALLDEQVGGGRHDPGQVVRGAAARPLGPPCA